MRTSESRAWVAAGSSAEQALLDVTASQEVVLSSARHPGSGGRCTANSKRPPVASMYEARVWGWQRRTLAAAIWCLAALLPTLSNASAAASTVHLSKTDSKL